MARLREGEALIAIETLDSKVWHVPVEKAWWSSMTEDQTLGEVHDFKVKVGFCGCLPREPVEMDDGEPVEMDDETKAEGEEMDDEAKAEGKKKKKAKKTKASSSRDPGFDKMD